MVDMEVDEEIEFEHEEEFEEIEAVEGNWSCWGCVCCDGGCCSLLQDANVGYEHWILGLWLFGLLWVEVVSCDSDVGWVCPQPEMPVVCKDIWLTECVWFWLFFGLSAFWFRIIVPVDVADDSVESWCISANFLKFVTNFLQFFIYWKFAHQIAWKLAEYEWFVDNSWHENYRVFTRLTSEWISWANLLLFIILKLSNINFSLLLS